MRLDRAWLWVAAFEAAAFGPFLRRVGFYHDDWTNLERAALPFR